MHVGWTRRSHGQVLSASFCLATVVILAAALGGCSHPASKTGSAGTAKQCGASRTPANAPVTISVNRGQVSCATAMTVEHDYAKAVDAGKAPGNGGGGPVPVDGWTCQGFPTPEVLKTGDTSKCVKDGTEILAILATPA